MKRSLPFLFVFLILFSLQITSVSADFGPKPTTTVTVTGIDEEYYFDFLVPVDSNHIEQIDTLDLEQGMENYYNDSFPSQLINFVDEDEFASYTLYAGMPGWIYQNNGSQYSINYFGPSTFKIAIVLKDSGIIIESPIVDSNAFNTIVTYDLSDVDITTLSYEGMLMSHWPVSFSDIGTVTGNYDDNAFNILLHNTPGLLLRIILTLAVELFVLYLFKFREKRTFIIVTITNLVTQLILSSIAFIIYANSGSLLLLFYLFFAEAIVLIVELIVYLSLISEKGKGRIIIYTVIANILSFLLSLLLTSLSFL